MSEIFVPHIEKQRKCEFHDAGGLLGGVSRIRCVLAKSNNKS